MADALPTKCQEELVCRALQAIGEPRSDDEDLNFERHLLALPEDGTASGDTAALRAVLGDHGVKSDLERICAYYREADDAATKAKRLYIGAMKTLLAAGTGLVLFACYLIVTPSQINWPARLLLCLVAGLSGAILAALLSGASGLTGAVIKRLPLTLKSHLQMSPTAAWLLLAVIGIVAGVGIAIVLPADFFARREILLLATAAMLLAVATAGDAMSGGITARAVDMASPQTVWYGNRYRAEQFRRQYFTRVVDACAAASPLPPPEVPLPLQALAFLRRFHLEPQARHYRDSGNRNKCGDARAQCLQLLVLAAVAAVIVLILIGGLGGLDEQKGGDWLPANVTASLLRLTQAGYDDIIVIIALVLLGIALVARSWSAFEQHDRNHVRSSATLARLIGKSSQKILCRSQDLVGALDLNDGSDLSSAELDAADGNWRLVRRLCNEVNIVLADEINDWSGNMWVIERIGEPAQPRLLAPEKISSTDFDRIAAALEAYGVRRFRARKVGFVAVRVANAPETVITRFFGVETTNKKVVPGDWIVVNIDKDYRHHEGRGSPDAHLVQDDKGNMDRYVISKKDVKESYRATQVTTSEGVIHEALTQDAAVEVLQLRAGFDILAPWDERQIRQSGVLVRRANGEVYGIYDRAFDKTYERVP